MQCNPLNEGCSGGWPHMHGYFYEQGYMVSEECAPYLGVTKGQSCKNYEHCKPIAKV
jgi:Papain family cysteine protease